ncbi:cytochrome P450 monooxygenase 72 [Heterobasidion irregulare TC 32-1]|uniref:Cytochrome P450 monooxygenase 72 n=1 Tax=Heterobasidion irregulare (strain TC 32-1) TaxID=747525 RepID=W4K1J1_HETIT|nr:cytochrome P450 monooxygenase 72 [Heterobasidion irregulare TC 32-1]ETW79677.1 cytochrome P450 monooxygenase 72 [Heterobasidion irregulare TC 32-1]
MILSSFLFLAICTAIYVVWERNFNQLYNQSTWDFHEKILAQFGNIVRLQCISGDSLLYVADSRALHNILVKDQYTFEEASTFIESHFEILSLGEHHRKQRKLLNPVFSAKHMRSLTPVFYKVTDKFRRALTSKIGAAGGKQEVDVMVWMSRIALKLIGQGALGYSFDNIGEEGANEYGKAAKAMMYVRAPVPSLLIRPYMPALFVTIVPRQLLPWVSDLGSASFWEKAVRALPSKPVRALVDIVDIMDHTSREILERKEALQKGDAEVSQEVGEGKDIISVITLIIAAMDTTSAALSCILYLLSQNIDVQDKLRAELTRAREESRSPIGEMDYSQLARKDVMLPLGTLITGDNGQPISEVFIPCNTDVICSIIGVNHNPAIWGPDATTWRLERWLEPLPPSVSDVRVPGVYSNMMTFAGGARACIGFKFSELEMKVVLAMLLPLVKFAPSGKRVVWNIGTVSTPRLPGTNTPTMPLVLSLIDAEN